MNEVKTFRIKFTHVNGTHAVVDFRATSEEDALSRFKKAYEDDIKGENISIISWEDLKKEREGQKDKDAKLEADFIREQDATGN